MKWFLVFLLLAAPAWADTNVRAGQITPQQPVGAATPRTLAVAGTAQNFQNATPASSPLMCFIKNPISAADQGIGAAENAYVNPAGTATTAGGGSTIPLEPGTWIVTGPQTGAVSWNAATIGHTITGFCWQ